MNYNEPFKLKEQEVLDFPDFTLKYAGTQKIDMPHYSEIKMSTSYMVFDIHCKATNTDFSETWGEGTGDHIPLSFMCNNKKFSFKPWEDKVSVIEETL